MTTLGFAVHVGRTDLVVVLSIVVVLGGLALWKRHFAHRAIAWPTIDARIENVLLNYKKKWRRSGISEETHAVLAYAYSVDDNYYSGEIKLETDERNMEELEKLVGGRVRVHYHPQKPAVSIFLKHKIRGWFVMADSRISLSSWLDDWF